MTALDQRVLWSGSGNAVPMSRPLSGDTQADLTIIGAGFTGCAAALAAVKAGASVCLIEAETVAYGGSGRNVGLVNAGLWTPPEEIIAALGEKAGKRLNAILAEAPSRVFALIEEHGISCDATHKGTLHCAHSPTGMRDLRERHRQLRAIGAPVELLARDVARRRTGTDAIHGALFDPRAGTIQPHAYALGLAGAAQAAGARIHEQTTARAVTFTDGQWIAWTSGGTIRSKAILQATNAYLVGDLASTRQDFIPVHYAQIATAPLPDAVLDQILPGKEGCWDTAMIMSSFRLDQAGRLIVGGVGGLGNPTGRIHANWAVRKLAALFPQAANLPVDYCWHGRIAMTSDHLPKIVQIGPNALSCFGYSGRGIGPGTVFGEAAAMALLSGDIGDLPLPPMPQHTERFKRAKQAYYEAGAALTHFFKDRG